MQYACAILSSMDCPALQYFSRLSDKTALSSERKVLNKKKSVLISLQFSSETFLILRRTQIYYYVCT